MKDDAAFFWWMLIFYIVFIGGCLCLPRAQRGD